MTATKDKPFSPFRGWVHQRWIENCEEHNLYGLPKSTVYEYWKKHKWFLKRKYRESLEKEASRVRF